MIKWLSGSASLLCQFGREREAGRWGAAASPRKMATAADTLTWEKKKWHNVWR